MKSLGNGSLHELTHSGSASMDDRIYGTRKCFVTQ